jgi:hypothetical protein
LLSSRPAHLSLGRRRIRLSRLKLLGVLLVAAAVHAVVAGTLTWASFGFRYSAFHAATAGVDRLDPGWEKLLERPGPITTAITLARRLQVLPEAFLFDYALMYRSTRNRLAFLNGEHSAVGWPAFFPYAFLAKTPLPVLLIFCLAVAALLRRRRDSRLWHRTLPLWIFLAVYWTFSILSHINIGHRHLLPTYPVVYILAGGASSWLTRKHRLIGSVVVAAGLWLMAISLGIRPHYLAYFNEFAGGPRQGYRHLVDSSLDWGQDLPGLKSWLLEEGLGHGSANNPAYLSYFGMGDPASLGIAALRLPGYPDLGATPYGGPLRGGVYCISATSLQQVYSSFNGPWAAPYEDLYQRVVYNLGLFRETAADPAARRRLIDESGEAYWEDQFTKFSQMRFARLCAYLRRREPDDSIGYSILIYRLSDLQVEAALFGPLEHEATGRRARRLRAQPEAPPRAGAPPSRSRPSWNTGAPG